MPLASLLQLASAADIDPELPLVIGGFALGQDAASEAIALFDFPSDETSIRVMGRPVEKAFYWEVVRRGGGVGELFGLPAPGNVPLPTAVEIALVRALAACSDAMQAQILAGDVIVARGVLSDLSGFLRVAETIKAPNVGSSILWSGHSRVNMTVEGDHRLTSNAIKCLEGSFQAAPLKFRYLELYRIIEAHFLDRTLEALKKDFSKEPRYSVEKALQKLKSEVAQIAAIAEEEDVFFESIWQSYDSIKNQNSFAAALFKKLDRNPEYRSPKCRAGAALLYFTRCAIVHAGEKDMIFEAYHDADLALAATIESVEFAALAIAGVDIL